MVVCEMCGRTGDLRQALVEGVSLRVCSLCAKYGTIQEKPSFRSSHHSLAPSGPEYTIVENYASLLRTARETKGMDQKTFANLLQERESVVAKWEAGSLKPSIDSARRIGRILQLNLVQIDEDKSSVQQSKSKKDDTLTLGDFIKVRKRN